MAHEINPFYVPSTNYRKTSDAIKIDPGNERVIYFKHLSDVHKGDYLFIRVAMSSDPACPHSHPATAPSVYLSCDSEEIAGLEVLPADQNIYSINRQPESIVGTATIPSVTDGIVVVNVRRTLAENRDIKYWRLCIRNNDTQAIYIVWVVADNEVEAGQPWLDAPTRLDFGDLNTKTSSRALKVANRGTGPLTLTGPVSAGSFTLNLPAGQIPANSCTDITIDFNAPSNTDKDIEKTITLESTDSTAGTGPPHNGRVTLSATCVHAVEIPHDSPSLEAPTLSIVNDKDG